MKKPFFAAAFIVAALFISGCSSDEPPSELDILIEQLQTIQITSETVPEETSEETSVPENTDETSEDTSSDESPAETPEDTPIPDDTEEISEDTTVPEDTEETSDSSEDTGSASVTYNSITVTVLSVEDDNISVESGGIIYNIIIDEKTGILGGDISEGKTVTITYMINDEDSESNITAAVITVLPDN